MNKLTTWEMAAVILLIVGGLNWGLIGINPDWNLVHWIFQWSSMVERLVYILVGISAVWVFTFGQKLRKGE